MPETPNTHALIDQIRSGEKTGHSVTFSYPTPVGLMAGNPFADRLPPAPETLPSIELPDLNELYGEQAHAISISARELLTFINTPLLEDGFGTDDVGRDRWEKQILEVFGEDGDKVIKKNRYRPNIFMMVPNLLDFLVDDFKQLKPDLFSQHQDKFDQLQRLSQTTSKAPRLSGNIYRQQELSIKREVVAHYTLVAHSALEIVSGAQPTQEVLNFIEASGLHLDWLLSRELLARLGPVLEQFKLTFEQSFEPASQPKTLDITKLSELQGVLVIVNNFIDGIDKLEPRFELIRQAIKAGTLPDEGFTQYFDGQQPKIEDFLEQSISVMSQIARAVKALKPEVIERQLSQVPENEKAAKQRIISFEIRKLSAALSRVS